MAGQAEDLQRNAQGIAIIVDPRNDSHLLMAQMQVLFSKFHNRIVDWLREKGTAEQAIFTEAQRLVVWHYQWVILREFLPNLIGDGLTDALLAGGSRYYRPAADPFIPLEFADAAYRYGHGQLRESYRRQTRGPTSAALPRPHWFSGGSCITGRGLGRVLRPSWPSAGPARQETRWPALQRHHAPTPGDYR